ncbi:hypothetical protein [Paraburkholderia terrae]
MAMAITRGSFERELSDLLRRQPTGVTADLSDCMIAYWNGCSITYAYLGGSSETEEIIDDDAWNQWRPALEEWLANPAFSMRVEAHEWPTEELSLDVDT